MSFIKELRRAYPHMPMAIFVGIYEAHKDSDSLLEELDEAEGPHRVMAEEGKRAWDELGKRLSASQQHHKLKFMVSADVDLEHVQALIMYGFLAPGQRTAYIGRHCLPTVLVRENTRNKLGPLFSEEKYATALAYLKKLKVLVPRRNSGEEEALSLRSSGEGLGHGAEIVRVAIEYANSKNRS